MLSRFSFIIAAIAELIERKMMALFSPADYFHFSFRFALHYAYAFEPLAAY